MYLVSDEKHIPTACFDHYEDAVAYICSWHQMSVRFSEIKPLAPTVDAVVGYVSKNTLGYIRQGIEMNPSLARRA